MNPRVPGTGGADDLDPVLEAALDPAREVEIRATLRSDPQALERLRSARRVLETIDTLPRSAPRPELRQGLFMRLDAEDAQRRRRSTQFARVRTWLVGRRGLGLGGGSLALATAVALALVVRWGGSDPDRALADMERLAIAEDLDLFENLQVVEHLDVLDDLELIESLPEDRG